MVEACPALSAGDGLVRGGCGERYCKKDLVRPVYIKSFSRDFTLAIAEIWARAETTSEKGWTKKQQPFLPYIVFVKTHGIIEGYYDPRGIEWLKKVLVEEVKGDAAYISFLRDEFKERFGYIRDICMTHTTLSLDELRLFLQKLEAFWPWFEGAWWLWEMEEHEREGIEIPQSLRDVRVESQDAVPRADKLVRSSLRALYPHLGELTDVIRTAEIQSDAIPDAAVLTSRLAGFVLIEDRLCVRASLADMETRFDIEFEKFDAALTDEIKGQTAEKGSATGAVKVLFSSKDNAKVNTGDILVSPMTMPDFLPAMKKAAAFVTDEGGIMCHAAIMARELKKPCIIGTKIATKVLKDGDMVEVDAEKGVVKVIQRA